MVYSKEAKSTLSDFVRQLVSETTDVSGMEEVSTFAYDSEGNPHQIDTVSSYARREGYDHIVIRVTYDELERLDREGVLPKPLKIGAKNKYYSTALLNGIVPRIAQNIADRKALREASRENREVAQTLAARMTGEAPEIVGLFQQMLDEYIAEKNKS